MEEVAGVCLGTAAALASEGDALSSAHRPR